MLSLRHDLKEKLIKLVSILFLFQALGVMPQANSAGGGIAPTGVNATQDGTTGVITVTWTATDPAVVGYKVVIDSAGSNKKLEVAMPTNTSTSFRTCYPYSGKTEVYVATIVASDLNPAYTASNPENYFGNYTKNGGFNTSGTTCTGTALYNYDIRFNGNTGSGTTPNQSGLSSLVTLNSNQYTKSGYTFSGWCKNIQPAVGTNCSGTSYANNADIILANSTSFNPATLYAIWLDGTTRYSVTYDGNAGSDSVGNLATDSTAYVANDTLTVTSAIPTRGGYSFGGWNDNNAGTGIIYLSGSANDTYTVTSGNVIFYARWAGNQYSYNGNTASGSTASQTFSGPAILARNNGFTVPTGYTFDGWCTTSLAAIDSTCGGTKYAEGATLPTPGSSTVTLYAVWKADTPAPTPAPPLPVYEPHPPTVTNISAPEVCAVGSQLTLTGTYLLGASVTVDGVAAQVLSSSNASMLISLPARSVGTKTIVVTNVDGSASTTVKYKFVDTPIYVNYIYPETFKNRDFSYTFKATNAEKYSIIGTMPAGLTLNPLTGEVSGAPTVEGDFVFTIVASNFCDDAYLNVYMFVDREIPNTFTCSVAFNVPKSDNISDVKLSQLKTCLDKIKTLTPKYNEPIIYLSGGLPAGLSPQEALVSPRYIKIIDFIKSIGLDYQIYVGAFGGTTDSVQINVYWPST